MQFLYPPFYAGIPGSHQYKARVGRLHGGHPLHATRPIDSLCSRCGGCIPLRGACVEFDASQPDLASHRYLMKIIRVASRLHRRGALTANSSECPVGMRIRRVGVRRDMNLRPGHRLSMDKRQSDHAELTFDWLSARFQIPSLPPTAAWILKMRADEQKSR